MSWTERQKDRWILCCGWIPMSWTERQKDRWILCHSKVVEILSNLAFGGYLAGTTPILSIGFSLFLFHRFCLEHVRTVQLTDDFCIISSTH